MVEIIEQDYDRCLSLANQLPDVTIVHGDASNEFLLERERMGECDALVTLTGVDEMNMFISLIGSSAEVPQIITKLGRLSNNRILDKLPEKLGSGYR